MTLKKTTLKGLMPLRSRLLPPPCCLFGPTLLACLLSFFLNFLPTLSSPLLAASPIDFNRDIRKILSDNCFSCHGHDHSKRKGGQGGLGLDSFASATTDLGGYAAVVPGNPEQSELLIRIQTTDSGDRMPPVETGKTLSPREIQLLKQWIQEGAQYSGHWAYTPPAKSPIPEVSSHHWPTNPIDYFILHQLDQREITPNPPADPLALFRRVSLDLTGLPPTPSEIQDFLNDTAPGAYERKVEELLKKSSFGEHWARLWLDQARYADSTGYADDPPRTIWAYRDYVIQALNKNKPFDLFTREQLAGDLLENPQEEQLIATAFHRNTLTNNEGGTNDEEYRNVAIVDRVNTTMEVWMGTTMACAQCHTHKYDPISQEEYFRMFAILNNTADADRRDESPFLPLFTPEQKQQRSSLEQQAQHLQSVLNQFTPPLRQALQDWESLLQKPLEWKAFPSPLLASQSGASLTLQEDGSIFSDSQAEKETYTLSFTFPEDSQLSALQLDALADERLPGNGPGLSNGNFVLSSVQAKLSPPSTQPIRGRFVRVELPGEEQFLSLAEVQVWNQGVNLAPNGVATQSSTDFDGAASRAIDGNTSGDYNAHSTTHTARSKNPWWELDLRSFQAIDRISLWNRTDNNLQSRLKGFRLAILDQDRNPVWESASNPAPDPSSDFSLDGARDLTFASAFSDYHQPEFTAERVLPAKAKTDFGWAVGGETGKSHFLVLAPSAPIALSAGSTLTLTLHQTTKHTRHVLGRFKLSYASEPHAPDFARVPADLREILAQNPKDRSSEASAKLESYFLSVTPLLQEPRQQLAQVQGSLNNLKPYTTVPVLQELPKPDRRTTHIQIRGNFLDTDKEVSPGLPEALAPLKPLENPTRLDLANWLVSRQNPLTARVLVNRIWESIFGIGIVSTSEEFGSQGELPSHPELLDWLAVEVMESGWDVKNLIRLLVTSSTYRQGSQVTPEALELDPDNRLLARGPRYRMSAEMIRDQALFVSGLLSPKMFGPPVKPFQPKLGVSAAFGSGIDWETSMGEDRYRRGIYTTWRRSNPYPSMAAFDAPNREVCIVKRDRTNTPLQALVTLNDPVYIEAAQALGRRMADQATTLEHGITFGFQLCLTRSPDANELSRLVRLFQESSALFLSKPQEALSLATDPLGPLPNGSPVAEMAAWTLIGNVLLNLDELFMKP